MPSVVDICNSALNQIGASNIVSLTEDSKAARICNQRYDSIRDGVFRSHPWNCLVTSATLSPDSASPAFDFSYQFTLPTDPYCLRIIRLDSSAISFKVEGRKILADESTINLIYLARVTDTNQLDMLLTETLSAAMAADIAYPLIGSVSLASQMRGLYELKLKDARFVDATEGTAAALTGGTEAGGLESSSFVDSRL